MNTPDEFYFSGTATTSALVIEFGFDADLVQVVNDGGTTIRVNSLGGGINTSGPGMGHGSPEVYAGETLRIEKTAGQRLRITVGTATGTSAFRVYAYR